MMKSSGRAVASDLKGRNTFFFEKNIISMPKSKKVHAHTIRKYKSISPINNQIK